MTRRRGWGAEQLLSEQNTRAVERLVKRAARSKLGLGLVTFFEHDQWWVERKATGAVWSVCDAMGPGTVDGFDFERVSQGDE
jgi:hypothetical protein